LIKNKFYQDLQVLYEKCPTKDELLTFLGRARAKRGMFEGDLIEGRDWSNCGLTGSKISRRNHLEMIADYNAARQEIVAIDFNYRNNDQN
jgi:enoyl-[acyl-carrier protein] reductase II